MKTSLISYTFYWGKYEHLDKGSFNGNYSMAVIKVSLYATTDYSRDLL